MLSLIYKNEINIFLKEMIKLDMRANPKGSYGL